MKQKFAVIGLGNFGGTVAVELVRLQHEVLGIDVDPRYVDKFADKLTQALVADGTDERVIEELGLKDYSGVVVAIGENIEASILTTLALKSAGCKQVWVKALSDAHHLILQRMQADRIIHPENEIGVRVAKNLTHPQMLDYIALGHGWFVVEIKVNELIASKTNYDTELELAEVTLMAVKRGSQLLPPPYRGLLLQPDDQIVLCGLLDNLLKFAKKVL